MQTQLDKNYLKTAQGGLAEKILRSCVHCGFCNATCPTYQLSGNELDGPRGRIYLIKQMLEGEHAGAKTALHLEQCLTCLSCETTCPSGVQYHQLLEIGRSTIQQQVKLPFRKRLLKLFFLKVVAYPNRFQYAIKLGQIIRPILPSNIKEILPEVGKANVFELDKPSHSRRMLILQGCVHKTLGPEIHSKTIAVFEKLGISIQSIEQAGCCGALSHHLQAQQQTLETIKQNIDAWWPAIEAGAEAIISNASACSLMLKDYGRLLQNDEYYAKKAQKIAELSKDISEILGNEDLTPLKVKAGIKKIAYHPPCTLQHGQKLPEIVETILNAKNLELLPIRDKHLCCGSAGSYSLMQTEISEQLRANKLINLEANQPQLIATANIGCLHHLKAKAHLPVLHWIELFE